MKTLKYILTSILSFLTINLVNAVQIVQIQNSPTPNTMEGHMSIWLILLYIFLGIIALGVVILIIWLIYKFIKKLTEEVRKGTDIEFAKFISDKKMCLINYDSKYGYRTWYTLWFWKKRCPVYATTTFGKKCVGYYEGEAVKKEGYFIFGLLQKYGWFKSETDVVILPFEFRHLFKKNDDFSIDIECEGIDEVMSSEFFSIPVFKNFDKEKFKKSFVDYSNEVLENYLQEYVYRDVIKNKMSEFRENVRDATEMNVEIQHTRKRGSDLKNN